MIKQLSAGIVLQMRSLWKVLFFVYLPILLLFLLVAIMGKTIEGVSIATFLRDVTVTAKVPFYVGFVSQMGLMLWSGSLAVCIFGLVMLRSLPGDFTAARRLLLYGAVFTIVLLMDDSFLFHEEIAPNYLHIDERFVYASYLIIAIALLARNWKEILAGEYLLFILALALFGASIFLDQIPVQEWHVRYFWEQLEMLVEDGSKFAGIATWLLFFARYAVRQIEATGRRPASDGLRIEEF